MTLNVRYAEVGFRARRHYKIIWKRIRARSESMLVRLVDITVRWHKVDIKIKKIYFVCRSVPVPLHAHPISRVTCAENIPRTRNKSLAIYAITDAWNRTNCTVTRNMLIRHLDRINVHCARNRLPKNRPTKTTCWRRMTLANIDTFVKSVRNVSPIQLAWFIIVEYTTMEWEIRRRRWRMQFLFCYFVFERNRLNSYWNGFFCVCKLLHTQHACEVKTQIGTNWPNRKFSFQVVEGKWNIQRAKTNQKFRNLSICDLLSTHNVTMLSQKLLQLSLTLKNR